MPSIIEAVPIDVLFNIFRYLAPLPPPDVELRTHPFLSLSSTSKPLRSSLETFCGHLLLSSGFRQRSKVQKMIATNNQRLITLHGNSVLLTTYLKAASTFCFLCGKNSSRRAVMDEGVVCCQLCDRKHWGLKITMTDALKKYHLKKEDLFGGLIPENLGGPRQQNLVSEDNIIPQRPGLRYGQYTTNSVLTTMFLEKDVRELACVKHNTTDLDGHRRARRQKYLQKQAKAEQNKRKKLDYLRRLAIQNGLPGDIAERLFQWINRRRLTPLQLIRNELLMKKIGIRAVDFYYGSNPRPYSEASPSKCWFYLNELLPENECDRYYEYDDIDWSKHCYYRYHRTFNLRRCDDDQNKDQYIYLNCRNKKLIRSNKDDFPMVTFSFHPAAQLEEIITSREVTVTSTDEDYPYSFYSKYSDDNNQTPEIGEMKVRVFEWLDPIDKCLFDEFVKEFGSERIVCQSAVTGELADRATERLGGEETNPDRDISTTDLYPDLGLYHTLKRPYIQDIAKDPILAPWSWGNYPIYVEDVLPDTYQEDPNIIINPNVLDSGHISTTLTRAEKGALAEERSLKKAKDEAKIAKRNEKTRQEVDAYMEKIRAVLMQKGVEYLAVDNGKPWANEIANLMNNLQRQNHRKNVTKARGKGKTFN